ncbi:hypothetical protein [Humidesulfovibrio idahonensis]
MLIAMLLLSGCAKPFELSEVAVAPIPSPVTPQYVPGSGQLVIEDFLVLNGTEYSLGSLKALYTVAKSEDGLLWAVTFSGGKVTIAATVHSDKSGSISDVDILNTKGKVNKEDPAVKKALNSTGQLFNCFFMPYTNKSTANLQQISDHAPLDIPDKDTTQEKTKAILSGVTTYNGTECYVIKARTETTNTNKATREVITSVTDAFILVDRFTMMPVIGEARTISNLDSRLLRNIIKIKRIKAVQQ